MSESEPPSGPPGHSVMQPLNVIQLACGNIRLRILPGMAGADGEYLSAKLDRIEEQIARLAAMFGEPGSRGG